MTVCSAKIKLLFVLVALLTSAAGEKSPDLSYKRAKPSAGGTGKFFMGREIAHYMSHEAAAWLERPEREKEEATSQVIAGLQLAPNAVVADIGAGSGYYTVRLSPLVPKGKVIAVDIQKEMLALIGDKARRQKLTNIELVLGSETSPNLRAASVDVALIVDAYHEFSHPKEMGSAILKALKPNGKLVLVEYRGEDPKVPIKRLHKMTEAQAKSEMIALGFRFLGNKAVLPIQHFLVFSP